MKFQIITLFPEMFDGVLNSSMMWKAQDKELVSFELINLRDFGLGPRRQVDDTPYGGGDGMLLMIEPLVAALGQAKSKLPNAKVLLMSPSEHIWSQQDAREYAASGSDYTIICGRYEGVDARIEQFIDAKVSVGRYVLTGGELPAMTVIDSIVRLLPGVLGGEQSAAIESYSDGDNLEYPQYTRPEEFKGMKVPEVLLSGNHGEVDKWRAANSMGKPSETAP
ncbi:MAG: tRNA (guanosine(37)-N1)-methyltransferase TrmD [Candidatus Nomurabacteria bacterium]|jgi:tRNA (guanine37-N1)-methyltransferase|nr:tRNA (guanosine(37)-N1)-methyltransferase TrmD [Candidatus Nomurabacteria bacterium]